MVTSVFEYFSAFYTSPLQSDHVQIAFMSIYVRLSELNIFVYLGTSELAVQPQRKKTDFIL